MSDSHYVVLTGCKNNSGDYFISHRARQLLQRFRPDREIIEFNAWEPIDDERLRIINGSAALLLTGGPALRSDIYPGIYRLRPNLDNIRVSIIPFGIGWKDRFGSWESVRSHDLSGAAAPLIERIANSGYLGSVRDHHSREVCAANGLSNILMTGCPGLYDVERLATEESIATGSTPAPRRIVFSPGIVFAANAAFDAAGRSLISRLSSRFSESEFIVAFHQSLDANRFEKAYGGLSALFHAQQELVEWLKSRSISYRDISGGVEPLLDLYTSCDFHVGYRVHAHIAMTSMGRPSVLLAEDGRGTALRDVLGGLVIDAFSTRSETARRPGDLAFWRKPEGHHIVPDAFEETTLRRLEGYLSGEAAQFAQSLASIRSHYPVMQRFLAQLP